MDDLPPELIQELSTILPEKPEPFECVICQEWRENRWPGAVQHWDIPPVCHYCETTWGIRNFGPHGAFRDRRKASQIKALAEALSAAAWQNHHKENGYGPTGLSQFASI